MSYYIKLVFCVRLKLQDCSCILSRFFWFKFSLWNITLYPC